MPVFERSSLSNGVRVLTAPMPQAQSVSCFIMFNAGSRYETPDIAGIAHFAEHMFFKGTERRPTARAISAEIDGIGGEFNAFTGKEYTGYYVKCAAGTRDVALDVLVDMIRNSRFDAEEIDREKGVIVEEMNMYFDTPRDFIGGVYDELLYGDHPLGRDIIGTKETVRAATPRDVHVVHRPLVPAGAHGRRGRRQDRRRPHGAARGAARLDRAARDRDAGARCDAAERLARLGLHEAVRSGPHRDRRPELSARAPRPLRAAAADDRARRRHVVAPLHRGARASRSRLLRLQHERELRRRRLALRAGRRRHQAASTTRSRRSRAELRRIADETVPSDELEKARAFAKGRFVLGIESPHGTTMYGLRREVLLGQAEEPEAMLAGLDAVTAEDIQRVAQDVVGKQLKLAVIGPFEDAERFERLLDACLTVTP